MLTKLKHYFISAFSSALIFLVENFSAKILSLLCITSINTILRYIILYKKNKKIAVDLDDSIVSFEFLRFLVYVLVIFTSVFALPSFDVVHNTIVFISYFFEFHIFLRRIFILNIMPGSFLKIIKEILSKRNAEKNNK